MNGLKFTWAQVVWAIGLIVTLVGGWSDLRYQIRTVGSNQAVLDQQLVKIESRVARIERHDQIYSFTTDDADELKDDLLVAMRRQRVLIQQLTAEVQELKQRKR